MREEQPLNIKQIKAAFRKQFCGGSHCDKYPCKVNTLNTENKEKTTFKAMITSCPYFYDDNNDPIIDIDKIKDIPFTVWMGGERL